MSNYSMANQKTTTATDGMNQASAQTESVKSRTTIHRLPQCVLLSIFRYLSLYDLLLRAGLVCKSWYGLVRDRELWMRVDLTGQNKFTPRDLFEGLFNKWIQAHMRVLRIGSYGRCKLKLRDLEKVLSYSNYRIQHLYLPHSFGKYESAPAVVLMGEYLTSLIRKCKGLKTLHLCRICDCWSSVINIDMIAKSNPSLKIETYVHVPVIKMEYRSIWNILLKRYCFESSDICFRFRSLCEQELKERKCRNYRSITKLFAKDDRRSNATHKRIESLCQEELKARVFREHAGKCILFFMKQEELSMRKNKKNHIYDSRKVRNKRDILEAICPPFAKVMNLPRTYQQPRKGPLRRLGPKCIKQ